MKREVTLLMVFFVLFFTTLAIGQVSVGFLGGVNIATLSGEDETGGEIDFESRTGFAGGGILDVTLTPNISLSFQPMYIQKGAKETEDGVEIDWKNTSLEVPVLLKVGFGTGSAKPYLMGGGGIGFLMSSKVGFSYGGVSADIDVKDFMKSTDMSVIFGGGVLFQLEKVNLFVDARYSLGLTDVFEGGTVEVQGEQIPLGDADIKTRGIQIFGGIIIPLGQ